MKLDEFIKNFIEPNSLIRLVYKNKGGHECALDSWDDGDGDAIWLSKYISLNEIKNLIEEYDMCNNTGWRIEEKLNHLNWGNDQEWAIITCDENLFNSQPSWITLRINY